MNNYSNNVLNSSEDVDEEMKRSAYSENNDQYQNNYNMNQNIDLIGLKTSPQVLNQNIFESAPNENVKEIEIDKVKDLAYYNKVIKSLNDELGISNQKKMNDFNDNRKNINIRKNYGGCFNSKRFHKNRVKSDYKENMKENNNKLKELENNKLFLLNKNKEIEEEINNLQNLANQLNIINEKNIIKKNFKEEQDKNNNSNNNYDIRNEINEIINSHYNTKVDENYHNNINNNFQNEEDIFQPFITEKNTNDKYPNLQNSNDNTDFSKNNQYQKKNKIKSANKVNANRNIYEKNKEQKENKTSYKKRKKTLENIRVNIKTKDNRHSQSNSLLFQNNKLSLGKKIISKKCVTSKNNKMKKIIPKINNNDYNEKINILKNIILQIEERDFNKIIKNIIIEKINEIQMDYATNLKKIEKKYTAEIELKNKKIRLLEKKNNDLNKKVNKIKSIV